MTFAFMALLFIGGLGAKIGALAVFLLACFTDWLDGYLARKYNTITDFGKFMDPIADKVLVLSAFFAFIQLDIIPAWMVVIIVLRESIITGLRLLAMAKGTVLAAQEGGKNKTVSQMIAIFTILIFLIVKEAGNRMDVLWYAKTENCFQQAIYILMLVTTALTVISGVSFLNRNKNLFIDK